MLINKFGNGRFGSSGIFTIPDFALAALGVREIYSGEERTVVTSITVSVHPYGFGATLDELNGSALFRIFRMGAQEDVVFPLSDSIGEELLTLQLPVNDVVHLPFPVMPDSDAGISFMRGQKLVIVCYPISDINAVVTNTTVSLTVHGFSPRDGSLPVKIRSI